MKMCFQQANKSKLTVFKSIIYDNSKHIAIKARIHINYFQLVHATIEINQQYNYKF